MACLDFKKFEELILAFDQKTIIDQDKDKPLRYDVWKTTSEEVKNLLGKLDTNALPNKDQSPRILRKIEGALRRIRESSATGGSIQKDIFDSDTNIEMSIALHELMESVKGESDKARNLGLEITQISDSGVLPALPLSRVAASIGRKIAFQKGYRFKKATNADNSTVIESLYYDIGLAAIEELSKAGNGYATINTDIPTIFDYQNKEDLKKDFPKNDKTRSDVLSVSLNEKTLGIKPNTPTSLYFLNRTEADLSDTDLGVVTEKLRTANMITQPNTIVLPDTKGDMTDAELKVWDDGVESPDPKTEKARKSLYKKPLFVNNALHSFLQLMNEESLNTGKSATQRINEVFGTKKNMVRSLFGLKRSDDFSIDKKESVAGQNLSKTTPWDDLVEYYDLLQVDGERSPLHLPMKIGRNARLYYLNSVLNPHASKQMRYMLTPGQYTVDTGSADFDFLVHSVANKLKAKNLEHSYEDVISGETLTNALTSFDKFNNANTLVKKMQALGPLARQFEGVDIVSLLTGLQAVQDIRNPKGGRVTTEFTVSSDATASGGTLTFMQALGTNPEVTEVLQRIGMLLSNDTLVKAKLDDIYGLMSEAVTGLTTGTSEGLGPDIGASDITGILQDTLNMLFKKSNTENEVDIREFSKDPTMVFIYGQGKVAATETISRKLADRIIDTLDEADTRAYLGKLFPKKDYSSANPAELKKERGLYKDIAKALEDSQLPQELFDLMKSDIKDKYLSQYIARSQKVYNFVKKLPSNTPFKVLPLGAVLSGKKASRPGDLAEYGMPLTKTVEVNNKLEGRDDNVLTRREKLQKTVMDVSTTHGIDAGLLYHSVADVDSDTGVAVIHDDVRGTVQTVRAMEEAYVKTAIKAAGQYDVHQQIMEAVAAASPEVAATADFKALKAEIDEQVAEKKAIISEQFNENTTALIGEGTLFESFAKPVDTDTGTTVQSTIPKGTPLAEQDFGDKILTITEGDESVEVLAQEYWNNIQSRLDMVEKLKVCLS
jgi:hypothetical protein